MLLPQTLTCHLEHLCPMMMNLNTPRRLSHPLVSVFIASVYGWVFQAQLLSPHCWQYI